MCVCVFRQNRFCDSVLTSRPGWCQVLQVQYRDKAPVQVYSIRSTTGPSRVCELQVLTSIFHNFRNFKKLSYLKQLLLNFTVANLQELDNMLHDFMKLSKVVCLNLKHFLLFCIKLTTKIGKSYNAIQ